MFAASFINRDGKRVYYNKKTYFNACMVAMGISEDYHAADVIDNETGEVVRRYEEGVLVYLAAGWE